MRIKICCIASVDEARRAIAQGVDALGFVAAMPSGPGVVPESTIAEITATVPTGVATFLLTSETEAQSIIDQQRRCGVTTLQLVDRVAAGTHRELRNALPGIGIVQVIHVSGEAAIDEARSIAPNVDAILLASGRPNAAKRELGGTGRTHDWSISSRIVAECPKPVFLAGGLESSNVGSAIERVRPFGVDVCSGVRRRSGEGLALDTERLRDFVDAVQSIGRTDPPRAVGGGRP